MRWGVIMATFGEKLKSIRISRECSQEELAAILGTTKQVISRYENDQRTPKITVAREYANRLNIPLSALIDDKIDHISIKNIMPLPEMVSIPIIGTIACGEPFAPSRWITAPRNFCGKPRQFRSSWE